MGIGSETPKCFLNAMRGLRAKGYHDSITEIKRNLNLENYPQAKIEVMLIEATKEYYSNGNTVDNKLNIDTVLVDFGLLQGYNNRDKRKKVGIKEEKSLLTERRKKFLKESTYIKERQTNRCHNYKDLQNENNLKHGVDSLGKSTESRIDNVGKYIYNKKNHIEQYINKVMKNYELSNLDYLEDKLLPALSSIRQKSIIEEMSISECMNSILEAEYHDEASEALYKALCGEDDPPDKEWVATWLTNCIYEKFKDTIDRDIMLVSFALLPGYELQGKDGLKNRLNKYLLESIYSDTHPCKSRKPIEHIIGITTEKEEEKRIRDKLEARRKRLVDEFIEHIENKDCSEHTKNIKGYATSSKRNHSYVPRSQDILFSKENIKLAQRREKMIKNTLTMNIGIFFIVFLPLSVFGIISTFAVSKNSLPNSQYKTVKNIEPEESNGNPNRKPYGKSDGVTPNMALQGNLAFNNALLAHTMGYIE